MISKVMISMPYASKNISTKQAAPSFGLAKLNQTGIDSVDEFGYQRNTFLNDRLFEKQGIFKRAAITEELEAGRTFTQICEDYGCTTNAGSNAAFIENQILSKKGASALKSVERDEVTTALTKLYDHNYDNPELSTKATRELLERIAHSLSPAEYLKNRGLLDGGVE